MKIQNNHLKCKVKNDCEENGQVQKRLMIQDVKTRPVARAGRGNRSEGQLGGRTRRTLAKRRNREQCLALAAEQTSTVKGHRSGQIRRNACAASGTNENANEQMKHSGLRCKTEDCEHVNCKIMHS